MMNKDKDSKEFCGMMFASISDLSRGKAAPYLKEVHDENAELVVFKNNNPYVVVISAEKYESLKKCNKG